MKCYRKPYSKINLKLPLFFFVAGCLVTTGCSMKPLTGGLLNLNGRTNANSTLPWLDSYDEAMTIARTTGKPILADFTGTDWCVWCQRLEDEVFEKEEFLSWATENVVLLKVDYPQHDRQSASLKRQNERLKEQYGIDSFPTILLIDSFGNELGRTGYVKGGPAAWIPLAESIIDTTNSQ